MAPRTWPSHLESSPSIFEGQRVARKPFSAAFCWESQYWWWRSWPILRGHHNRKLTTNADLLTSNNWRTEQRIFLVRIQKHPNHCLISSWWLEVLKRRWDYAGAGWIWRWLRFLSGTFRIWRRVRNQSRFYIHVGIELVFWLGKRRKRPDLASWKASGYVAVTV